MKQTRNRIGQLGWVALLALAPACSSGGGSDGGKKQSPSFSMTYEAPSGSNFAGGELRKVPYRALVTRDLTLVDGVIVGGQVTDGGGAPLAGVKVSFHQRADGSHIDDETTDGAGNYAVRVGEGTWYVTLESNQAALGDRSESGVVVTGPGPVLQNFQFPAAVAVTGSVFEAGGPAIPGALLEFEGAQTGAQVSAVADGAGAYAVDLVPDTYDVVVEPVGGAAATHLKERFRGLVVAGAQVQDFSLAAGVQVSGTVLDDLGAALTEDTEVEVKLPEGSDHYAPAKVVTDPLDGSYSIGPVPPGAVTFRLEPPGDSGFPRQDFPTTVVAPGPMPLDFTLVRGFVLSGTILEDDGLTGADADLDAEPLDGSLSPDGDGTDGSGGYEISLFAGTYDVLIEPKDVGDMQLPQVLRVTITGDTVLDVTLTRGVLLEGNVTLPGGLVAEPDVRVEIAGVPGASAVTDSSGDYSMLVPEGTHTLSLVAEDGFYEGVALQDVSGVVVVAPGPVTQDVEMAPALTGQTVVTGTAYQPDGVTPLAGVEITARDEWGDELGRTLSLGDGSYVLVVR